MKNYTVEEAAVELGISVTTVYRYTAKNILGVKKGRRITVPQSHIDKANAEGLPPLKLFSVQSPKRSRRVIDHRSPKECIWQIKK